MIWILVNTVILYFIVAYFSNRPSKDYLSEEGRWRKLMYEQNRKRR